MKKILYLVFLTVLITASCLSQRLGDLKDVTIKYPSSGQVIRWRSGQWVNETMSTGTGSLNHAELSNLAYAASGHTGFAPTSHTHTLANLTNWADTSLTLSHSGHAHTLANISNWGDTTLTLSHAGHGHASTDISDWGTYINQAVLTSSTPSFAGLTVSNATNGIALLDASAAYNVKLIASSTTALGASRSLTFDVDNSSRVLKFSGNPTLGDWFDQSVKTTATPTLAGLTINGSSGNTLALETSGLVYDATNNRVGIGTASPSYPLHVSTTGTNNIVSSLYSTAVSGGSNGIYVAQTTIPAAASAAIFYGLNFVCQSTDTNTVNLTSSIGIRGMSGKGDHKGAGTATGVAGATLFADKTGTGTVTSAYGVYSKVSNTNATGVITNGYGVYIAAPNLTGAITNNWGFYQAGTENNYFAGKIGIGVTPDSGLTTASTVGANIGRGLKVGANATVTGDIYNDDILKCTITAGGSVTARTFTVNVRKLDDNASSNVRVLCTWWVSTSEYGAAANTAGNTFTITTGTSIVTASSTAINHAITDGSGNLVLTVTNSESSNPASVYFHVEVQGTVYTANGTVNRPSS